MFTLEVRPDGRAIGMRFDKSRQKMNSNVDGRWEFVTRNVLPVQCNSRREKCVISVKSLETRRSVVVAGI